MSLSNKRDCNEIWGSKPTALGTKEVGDMFKGILSSENEARAEMDYSYIPEDGAVFDRDVDYTVEQWRMGLIVPMSDDQVEDLIQQNIEATEIYVNSIREAYEDRGEEFPLDFEKQAYDSLEWKNNYLRQSAAYYRGRAVNQSRLDEMNEECEEKAQNDSSKKRRRV